MGTLVALAPFGGAFLVVADHRLQDCVRGRGCLRLQERGLLPCRRRLVCRSVDQQLGGPTCRTERQARPLVCPSAAGPPAGPARAPLRSTASACHIHPAREEKRLFPSDPHSSEFSRTPHPSSRRP